MKSLIHKCFAALAFLLASFAATSGLDAQVKRPTPAKSTPAKSTTPAKSPAMPTAGVSIAEAYQLFQEMAAQPDIAFRYVQDGCYARAHLMIQRMQERGVQPVRVWSFANGENLHVKTRFDDKGYVEWWYHVAPAVATRMNGTIVYLVIDPSMFDRPVTVEEWASAQKRTGASPRPNVQITKLGQAPVNPKTRLAEGTGYWPDKDPLGGIDAHAVATMRMYKAREKA